MKPLTPLHGDTRSHHYEFEAGPKQELISPATGLPLGSVTCSSLTVSVSERYCSRCGWSEVRGVMGALRWHAEHDGHGGEG